MTDPVPAPGNDDDPRPLEPRVVSSWLGDLRPLEVHALYRLRVDVFVAEQDCPYAEIDDVDAAPDTTHLLAWVGAPGGEEVLAATARVFPSPGSGGRLWHLGRVCTAPGFRGRGLAGDLVRRGIDHCGGHPIEIGAQTYLEQWYEGFGFRRSGDDYLDERITHLPMRLG